MANWRYNELRMRCPDDLRAKVRAPRKTIQLVIYLRLSIAGKAKPRLTRTIMLQDDLKAWLKSLPTIGNKAVSDEAVAA